MTLNTCRNVLYIAITWRYYIYALSILTSNIETVESYSNPFSASAASLQDLVVVLSCDQLVLFFSSLLAIEEMGFPLILVDSSLELVFAFLSESLSV